MAGTPLTTFGRELRVQRERAGLTQAELGERVGYGNGQVSKLETGKRVAHEDVCRALDELFGTLGLFDRLGADAREYASLTQQFAGYLPSEPDARAIHTYGAHLVVGLMQTESYARFVIEAERPRLAAGEVDARVASRLSRQDVIAERRPRVWAILDESVLYRRLGGTDVMVEQLRRLLERRPWETVQVLPFTAGASPAQGDTFIVAEFADRSDVAHVDSTAGLILPGDGDTAVRYRGIFDHLRSLALPEEDSLVRIEERAKELEGTR